MPELLALLVFVELLPVARFRQAFTQRFDFADRNSTIYVQEKFPLPIKLNIEFRRIEIQYHQEMFYGSSCPSGSDYN